MVLWFAGLSFLAVAWVFASPAIDYRLVVIGSVAPVLEMVIGGPWLLHTLLAPVALMTLVMLVWRGKRIAQRRWLGIPIGLFMYLVFDGAWARTTLFWWPLFGVEVEPGDTPSWESPLVLVLMELIGAAAIVWSIRRYRLDRPAERTLLLREGRLSRELMKEPPGTC
jgi:hypothetical protein